MNNTMDEQQTVLIEIRVYCFDMQLIKGLFDMAHQQQTAGLQASKTESMHQAFRHYFVTIDLLCLFTNNELPGIGLSAYIFPNITLPELLNQRI